MHDYGDLVEEQHATPKIITLYCCPNCGEPICDSSKEGEKDGTTAN